MASCSLFSVLQGFSGSRQHALSTTLSSPVCLLLLALSATLSLAVDFRVEWTPEGVRDYGASGPLLVELGDRIILECPKQGAFNYSNLWIQEHLEQYMACNCMAVLGENCDFMVAKNAQCIPGAPNPVLSIRRNDAELNSVVNFNPGQQYFLTSYAPERSLAGAYSEMSNGGQCLDGLKMVIEVMELPTQPATTYSDQTEFTEEPLTGVETDPHPPESSSDENTDMEQTTELTTRTEATVPEIAVQSSREIRDWHVGVIVLLGAMVVAVIAIFIIVTVSITLYRRRGVSPFLEKGTISAFPVAENGETPNPDPFPSCPEEKTTGDYPSAPFVDPVDCS